MLLNQTRLFSIASSTFKYDVNTWAYSCLAFTCRMHFLKKFFWRWQSSCYSTSVVRLETSYHQVAPLLSPTIRRTIAWLDHFSGVILPFVPFSVLVWWNKNGHDTLTSNLLSCLNLFRFSDMRLDDDNGIPTQEFLDSCYAIVPVLGRPWLSRHSSS